MGIGVIRVSCPYDLQKKKKKKKKNLKLLKNFKKNKIIKQGPIFPADCYL